MDEEIKKLFDELNKSIDERFNKYETELNTLKTYDDKIKDVENRLLNTIIENLKQTANKENDELINEDDKYKDF